MRNFTKALKYPSTNCATFDRSGGDPSLIGVLRFMGPLPGTMIILTVTPSCMIEQGPLQRRHPVVIGWKHPCWPNWI